MSMPSDVVSFRLLADDEAAPYAILNPQGSANVILTCEHAGAIVPASLGLLGMDPEDYTRHYAVDVGIRRVAETLSALLDAPLILGNYSRLVVDLNRDLDHPTAFVTSGEGKVVPGNIGMTAENRAARVREIYDPYNAALSGMIDHAVSAGRHPAIVSLHSFTPQYFAFRRPWEVGFLWTHDSRLSQALIGYFRQRGFVVGDNQPYDHRIVRGSAINRHADARRLSNTLLEIRNDLILNDNHADHWAKLLADGLHEVLAEPGICSYYDGPLTEYDPDAERIYFQELIEKSKRGEHHG